MKRILSLILTLTILLVSVSVTAFAASGTSGDDLSWSYDEATGVLTFSGKGEIKGTQYWDDYRPWNGLDVTAIVVEDGITALGSYCLSNYDGVPVYLPASLTSIDGNALDTYSTKTVVYYYGTVARWNDVYEGTTEPATVHCIESVCKYGLDGTHTKQDVCMKCGEVVASETSQCPVVDGVCSVCGGRVTEEFAIAGTNMTLANELLINFVAKKTDVTEEMFAVMTRYGAEGAVTEQIDRSDWVEMGEYYKIPMHINAAEMTDIVTMTIEDRDGVVYSHYTDCVADYIDRLLGRDDSTEVFTRLAVDILNYGTLAQEYFDYAVTRPANANLTNSHRNMATNKVECADQRSSEGHYYGTNVSLEERILLNVFFNGLRQKDISEMYATVSFTNCLGAAQEITVPGTELVPRSTSAGGSDIYSVAVDAIVLGDCFEPVTVTVYNADGTVHGSVTDSVESYAARMQNKNEAIGELVSGIMKLSASAYHYLTGGPHVPAGAETVTALVLNKTADGTTLSDGTEVSGTLHYTAVDGEEALICGLALQRVPTVVEATVKTLGETADGIPVLSVVGSVVEPVGKTESLQDCDPYNDEILYRTQIDASTVIWAVCDYEDGADFHVTTGDSVDSFYSSAAAKIENEICRMEYALYPDLDYETETNLRMECGVGSGQCYIHDCYHEPIFDWAAVMGWDVTYWEMPDGETTIAVFSNVDVYVEEWWPPLA